MISSDYPLQTLNRGNKQALEGLKQGVEGARHNWNGLLKSDYEAEEVVKQKLSSASDKDKALLQQVIDSIEKEKAKQYSDLDNAQTCFLAVI